MKVIKKDGTLEDYDFNKIKSATNKSAERVLVKLSDDDFEIAINPLRKVKPKEEINQKEQKNKKSDRCIIRK